MSLDAMKQALEALEQYTNVVTSVNDPNSWVTVSDGGKPARDAITALRAAIEQAQEPVAWVYQEGLEALKSGRPWTAYGSNGGGRIPLYLNDAVAPRAEPRESGSGAGFESLPASPKWQGLTDDEIERACVPLGAAMLSFTEVARAIEAKLKAKNS